jgi:hypothetical protein
MALRLSLVIEGDAASAKQAVAEVVGEVEKLGATTAKADQASAKAAAEAQDANLKTRHAAREAAAEQAVVEARAKRTATGFKEAGTAAQRAGTSIVSMGGVAKGAIAGIIGVIGFSVAGAIAGTLIGAFNGAIGAAAGLLREIVDDAPRIERDLKAHAGLVDEIVGAYKRAQGAASDYGKTSKSELIFSTQQNTERLRGDYRSTLYDLPIFGSSKVGGGFGHGDTGLGPFRDEVAALKSDLKDGVADINAFRERIAEIGKALPADSPFRRLGEDILKATEKAATIETELQRSIDLFKGLTGDAEAAATALGGTADKFTEVGSAVGGVLPALREYDALLASIAARGSTVSGGSVAPLTAGGSYTPYAAGGAVSGPGTGTSDSILALVSDGEFIVNAGATARHRPLLEAINGAAPHFAAGGLIGLPRFASGGSVAGGTTTSGLKDEVNALSGAVSGLIRSLAHGSTVMDALSSAALNLADHFLDVALRGVDTLLEKLLGGAVSSVGSIFAGTGHQGAIIGAPSTSMRRVPAATFIGAPRMHGGGTLHAGEKAFIGMDGEEIGWPHDLQRKYGGGSSVNVFNVSTPSPKAFAASQATVARAAARLVRSSARFI